MSKKNDKLNEQKERLLRARDGLNKQKYKEKIYEDLISESAKNITMISIDKLYDAPKEINFFPPITEDKMLEMVFSILENGLFNPIIIWNKNNDGKYMILAGHNRVEAYRRIMLKYKDEEGFDVKKYEEIPAIIYETNEIDMNKAKEIAIDTNYIQRKEDRRLAPIIIKNRLDIVRDRKDVKGQTIDIVADELGLSKTKVYEDYVIAESIIPELTEFYFEGHLNKKMLLKFNWYNKEMQSWIYNEFKDRINNKTMNLVKRNMAKDELAKVFINKHEEKVRVSFVVPKELEDRLREYVESWIKEKIQE